MTRKKFKDPSMDQWFIELESVITHEILSYIVDRRAVEEGHYMWSGLVISPFLMEVICRIFVV